MASIGFSCHKQVYLLVAATVCVTVVAELKPPPLNACVHCVLPMSILLDLYILEHLGRDNSFLAW